MYRLLPSLLLLLTVTVLHAQADAYDGQIRAVEQMLESGKYGPAIAQSKALAESGAQAQLPAVKARGEFLLARALIENPGASARERVEGIRNLRSAAQGFKAVGDGETVLVIIGLLKELTGDESIGLRRLPSQRRQKTDLPPDDSIEAASLTALVSLQQREITALNDSQLRQVLRLERQQRQLDDNTFDRLNDSLLLLQQERMIATQQAEVTRQTGQRNLLLMLALGVLTALAFLYLRYRSGQKYQAKLRAQNKIISEERQRSEELLLNILPVTVAAELKEFGKATARRYDSATVLFADFKGFSTLAATLEPEELINLLDEAFCTFDGIVRKHGLEKIKTIGDAYMCAGGVPEEDPDHATRMVRVGLEMQAYLEKNAHFKARIGIHTGPVVAGVVGQHKFVYDIWGDTVNQASRLETAGEVGRVAISHTTKDLLGKEFVCTAAGTFEAKNIGTMERYFVRLSEVEGLQPE
jgi:class 3 adenylate cyclase